MPAGRKGRSKIEALNKELMNEFNIVYDRNIDVQDNVEACIW